MHTRTVLRYSTSLVKSSVWRFATQSLYLCPTRRDLRRSGNSGADWSRSRSWPRGSGSDMRRLGAGRLRAGALATRKLFVSVQWPGPRQTSLIGSQSTNTSRRLLSASGRATRFPMEWLAFHKKCRNLEDSLQNGRLAVLYSTESPDRQ